MGKFGIKGGEDSGHPVVINGYVMVSLVSIIFADTWLQNIDTISTKT
jgi:hypothetical protein